MSAKKIKRGENDDDSFNALKRERAERVKSAADRMPRRRATAAAAARSDGKTNRGTRARENVFARTNRVTGSSSTGIVFAPPLTSRPLGCNNRRCKRTLRKRVSKPLTLQTRIARNDGLNAVQTLSQVVHTQARVQFDCDRFRAIRRRRLQTRESFLKIATSVVQRSNFAVIKTIGTFFSKNGSTALQRNFTKFAINHNRLIILD